jgi:phosphate transport system permease protein
MSGRTTTGGQVIEGFGQVSRTVGTVFRYGLLAATLVGIVALGLLLLTVTYDAIQPLTADPGYWLVFFLLVVVPAVATGVYLDRRTANGLSVGATALGTPLVSLLFGSGVAVLFIDIVDPVTWLGYVLALTVTGLFVVAMERTVTAKRLEGTAAMAAFVGKLVLTAAVLVGSVLLVPPAVAGVPVLPSDGIIMALTFGGPIALFVRQYLRGRWKDARAANGLGAGLFVATLASPFVLPFVGLTQVPAAVLTATVLTPTAIYWATVYRERGPGGDDESADEGRADRLGLLLPVVVVGGTFLAAVVVGVLGFAGPESWVDWQFLTTSHSNQPAQAGYYPAMVGSIMLMLIVAVLSFPLGVGAAVYLEEYAPDNRLTRLIRINISNLAGVPSIVYGLLGLGLFIRYLGSPPGTVFVGGLALALLILPIVIISAQEAVRSVPDGLRQASYGMGATRYQTIREVVLPRAFPGILTGTILSLGRAVGETAPLLVIGAPNVFDLPTELTDRVGAMPLQIYVWATTFASPEFYTSVIPAAVIVLLVVLLVMNSVAIVLRNKYQREA